MDVTTSSMVMEIKVFTKALSNLQLKQYKRDIHFNNSMSNLQMVEMKYMYTDWLKLLDGLCGVVVKTPAWESKDPRFEFHLTVHRKSRRLLNAFVIECD